MQSKTDRLSKIFASLTILLGQYLSSVRTMEDTGVQETSGAYLRNVVNELQLLNGIVPSSQSSASHGYYDFDSPAASQNPATATLAMAALPLSAPAPAAAPPLRTVPTDINRQASIIPKYDLQTQVISKSSSYLDDAASQNSMLLGFTPAELATMYRKAIERGTAVKYHSLVNTINRQAPKIIGAPFELADDNRPHPGESQYAYYFYPLQTFRHELTNHYGYKTLPDFKYDSTPAENSKKETSTMNPILVGISSFLGMALFFMLSLFFYPRFMHFPFVTTSRTAFQNEIMNLTTFVTEAIDYYNKNVEMKSNGYSSMVQLKRAQAHKKL